MAKVPFTKLKLKVEDSIKELKINDEVIIEVKQYLPIQDKLRLIGNVVNWAHEEDNNYSNPVKVEVIKNIELIVYYTNITFTEKQKENLPKLYDQFVSSGMMLNILNLIPSQEREQIEKGILDTIEAVYKYQNSALGILDTLKTDYSNLQMDIDSLKEDIQNPENLQFLKELLTNFG